MLRHAQRRRQRCDDRRRVGQLDQPIVAHSRFRAIGAGIPNELPRLTLDLADFESSLTTVKIGVGLNLQFARAAG